MGCPVAETLRWFLTNEHSRSPESTRPSVEVVEVLTGSDMEKAEELARDCMNTQIKILKAQAEQQMVRKVNFFRAIGWWKIFQKLLEQDAYKPSISNLTKLKRWLQTKISANKNRRIISPKVDGRRPAVKSPENAPKTQPFKDLKNPSPKNPPFQSKILPKLVRVPSKEHIRNTPGGDGSQLRGPISSLRLKTSLSNPREVANTPWNKFKPVHAFIIRPFVHSSVFLYKYIFSYRLTQYLWSLEWQTWSWWLKKSVKLTSTDRNR